MADAQTVDSVASRQSDIDAELAVSAAAAAASNALRAGSRAPLFTLPDSAGRRVSLDELLSAGPVVLHFFRGGWCTFAESSLADFAAGYEDVLALGASAVAIAPPCATAVHRAPGHLRDLLDVDLQVARAYGVAFELPLRLRATYERLGYTRPAANEASRWLVPIPATFLLDRDGSAALVHVDVDYRKSLDIESLLRALKALQTRHAADLHAMRERPRRSR
ncbi:peroxiredoxin-like family protein [Paraburkholderia aromaticivorans]|uniref:peroxiredoxin-like family protein n=1 Tax=Paraburkholderia aromaticivorans TaxID=2026199 RepID=UPI001455FBF1|nr:peroxiredoxin-like family protein [Paraburkholderia aromaticivorans]